MPDDVQTIVIVVIALVIIAAIVWGKRRVRIKAGGIEANVEDQERKVNVADSIELDQAKVGNVIGSRAGGDRAPATDISVMRNATVRGGEIGDIVGEEILPTPKPAEPPKKDE